MFTTMQISLGRFFIRLGHWIAAEVEPEQDSPGDPIAEIADQLNDTSALDNMIDAGHMVPDVPADPDPNIEDVAEGVSEQDWHPAMKAEHQANEEATEKRSWSPYQIPPVFRKSSSKQIVSGRGHVPVSVPHEVQYVDGSKTTVAVAEKTDRDLWRPDRQPDSDDHCFVFGYTSEAHE